MPWPWKTTVDWVLWCLIGLNSIDFAELISVWLVLTADFVQWAISVVVSDQFTSAFHSNDFSYSSPFLESVVVRTIKGSRIELRTTNIDTNLLRMFALLWWVFFRILRWKTASAGFEQARSFSRCSTISSTRVLLPSMVIWWFEGPEVSISLAGTSFRKTSTLPSGKYFTQVLLSRFVWLILKK